MLSGTDLLRREIIMGLMCRFCIDIEEVAKAHNHLPDKIPPPPPPPKHPPHNPPRNSRDGASMSPTTGRFLIRNIAMVFRCLPAARREPSRANDLKGCPLPYASASRRRTRRCFLRETGA